MNPPIQAATGDGERARHLYIDATGMLELGGQAHTGIPRVQDFLVRSAIADCDPLVSVVVYDTGLAAYRYVTEDEVTQLTLDVPQGSKSGDARTSGLLHSLCDAFQTINDNPHLGREFDREIARSVTGSRESSAKFGAVKYIIRLYRYFRKKIYNTFRNTLENIATVDLNDGILLFSHQSVVGHKFPECIVSPISCAFICHDLISWTNPELSMGKRQVERFNARFKLLIEHGARAVCISEASKAILDRFISENHLDEGPAEKISLPSILYEKALSNGVAARIPCENDFILYCSTIEVRKNHLLLAKIWKQARDEGVSLPTLICAGKWGWGVEDLKTFLDDNPALSQSIQFIGQVNDDRLIDLYRSALFGVMPSKIEGWGFGASECLDFGVPVIVSTAPALVEAVRGLMPAIDADNQDAWYAEIRRLSENVEARNALRDRIAQFYRPVTCESSWAEVKAALLN